MKSAVIEIKDEDIPTFYLDSLDHADRYDRKTVRLVGQAFADRSLPKGYYMFGRMAMTCCANDIQPIGWITQGIQKPSTKTYFRLTAQCKAVDAQGEKMLMLQEARAEIVPPAGRRIPEFQRIRWWFSPRLLQGSRGFCFAMRLTPMYVPN